MNLFKALRVCAVAIGFSIAAISLSGGAQAHPHVWVQTETTVLFDKGNISGLQEKWTFDEFYTETSIEGLDKNKDGIYSREELQELAQVNIDGMKDFGYFTYAKLGKDAVKFAAPKDYYLEHKDKILSLYFTLPLATPVPAQSAALEFIVDDPSFFIAFTPAEKSAAVMGAGAPKGCEAKIAAEPQDEAESKRLQAAFGAQLSAAGGGGASAPSGMAKAVKVSCPKS